MGQHISDIYSSSILMAEAEVGKHFYWDIAGFLVHGQVLLVIWFVIIILLSISFLGTSNIQQIPTGWQNFMECVLEFVTDIAKNQLGESFYRENTNYYSDSFINPYYINTETLDNLFPNESFDFIKIDTQGSEIDILVGGKLLVQSTEYILLEVSITNYNIGAPLIKDVLNYMDSIGFIMVDIWNCGYANRVPGKHYDDLCQIDVLFTRKKL
jgi:hypothetical protein